MRVATRAVARCAGKACSWTHASWVIFSQVYVPLAAAREETTIYNDYHG